MTGRIARTLAVLLLMTGAGIASPGGDGTDSSRALLVITSEPSGVRVYSDTTFLGTTPLHADSLPSGMLRLRILGADPSVWFSPVLFDSVFLVRGETAGRHVVLPRVVRVTSQPPGAGVRLGDTVLGTTPLYGLIPPGAVTLTLGREGFADQQMLVPDGLETAHAVLAPVDQAAGAAGPLLGRVGRSAAPVIVATAVAVVSGAASAYLKTRADTYYENYRGSPDGATLDRVRRYDLFSGITLGVAELSLGYLIVELLSR